jgi:SAM-dependent methyltransferase
MDHPHWKPWRKKLDLFDAFGRTHFAAEEREGTRLKARFFAFFAVRGRVLDLGCGTGFNRRFLPRATRYLGIDPLQLAPGYSFPFVRAVGEYLPWKPEVFDSVFCIATLDHVADPRMVIQECHRVLRPGGTLGIMTKVEFEGSRLARWMLCLRVGLRKLLHGNLRGLVRGLREVLTGAEDEFHMHHFSRVSLQSLCAESFGDISSHAIGNVLFLRGRKRETWNGTGAATAVGTIEREPCVA